jgi:uncharacterized protein YndB with AHSA1/START domain
MTHGLQVTTPSDLEIAMARTFDAPRARVYQAFTDPDVVRQWLLGPDGWSMPVCEIDLRVGGVWRYAWRSDADGNEFGMHGTYLEVTPRRIVHTEVYEGNEARVTTTFDEADGRTSVTMVMRFASQEARDAALATGMAQGVEASYARLERLVTEVPQTA